MLDLVLTFWVILRRMCDMNLENVMLFGQRIHPNALLVMGCVIHLRPICFKTGLVSDQIELRGHKDVNTTMIYAHGLNKGGRGVWSPADAL